MHMAARSGNQAVLLAMVNKIGAGAVQIVQHQSEKMKVNKKNSSSELLHDFPVPVPCGNMKTSFSVFLSNIGLTSGLQQHHRTFTRFGSIKGCSWNFRSSTISAYVSGFFCITKRNERLVSQWPFCGSGAHREKLTNMQSSLPQLASTHVDVSTSAQQSLYNRGLSAHHSNMKSCVVVLELLLRFGQTKW